MSQPNLAAVPSPAPRGPRYTFKFPERSRLFETDPRSVTVVPLTLEQDSMGNKLIEKSRSPFEKIKLAVVAVDGKPCEWGSGEVDAMLDKCSPPIRGHIVDAFLRVNNPQADDSEAFLASMEVSV